MTTDPARSSPTKKRKSQGRGRSNSLPTHVVDYLKTWLMSPEHINHPYPSEAEKARMVADTGIDIKRLNNWFVNNRIRFWKPRYEAMQKQLRPEERSTKIVKSNSLLSSETNSAPSPTELSRRSQQSRNNFGAQEVTRSDLPTPKLFDQKVEFGNLSSTAMTNDVFATVSDDDSCSSSGNLLPNRQSPNFHMKKTSMFRRCRKRQRTEIEDDRSHTDYQVEDSPRFKHTFNREEQWKLACSTSFSSYSDLDDTNLPSLDDAVHLFGYSTLTSN